MGILHEFFISPFEEFYRYRELIFLSGKSRIQTKTFPESLGSPLVVWRTDLNGHGLFVFDHNTIQTDIWRTSTNSNCHVSIGLEVVFQILR